MTQQVRTRFAPSPTGYLHIGGARTALFNWLFARHHGGDFLLRIEDTDKKRSTQDAIDAILSGLDWLGLSSDDAPVYQSARQERHVDVANDLLANGLAYRCYATPEELAALRDSQRAAGTQIGYDGRWRERDPSDAPEDAPFVIRFKAPKNGTLTIDDMVQGSVSVEAETLDDLVILRADGTPTYNLSVVVDDHDMGITHILRGDDHLTNAFRQRQISNALGWTFPVTGHVPLIHGPDGAKLSKRHGALGVDAYRDMGYLPEAMRNYLLRLGWAHGDEEIIDTERAIALFNGTGIGRGPARLDFDKMNHVNGVYMREMADDALAQATRPLVEAQLGRALTDQESTRWLAAVPTLKDRADTLAGLAEAGLFYLASRPIDLEEKAQKALTKAPDGLLEKLTEALSERTDWTSESLQETIKNFAEAENLGFGKVAQPLRAAICGKMASPGLTDVLYVLGKDETLARLSDRMTTR